MSLSCVSAISNRGLIKHLLYYSFCIIETTYLVTIKKMDVEQFTFITVFKNFEVSQISLYYGIMFMTEQ
jgi:hypothetical protein